MAAEFNEIIPVGGSPEPRYMHQMFSYDGKVYVHGGTDDEVIFLTPWEYDPATNAWTELIGIDKGRYRHAGCVLDGKYYTYGGMDEEWNLLNELWELDLTTWIWTQLAPTTETSSEYDASMVGYNGKLYVYTTDCDFWEYDVTGNTWDYVTLDTSGSPGPSKSEIELYDGKIYSFNNNSNTLDRYNIGTNIWTDSIGVNSPPTTNYAAIGTMGGSMYVHGGQWPSSKTDNMWKFDYGTETWELIGPGGQVIAWHDMAAVNTQVYFFGGELASSPWYSNSLYSYGEPYVEPLDPIRGHWWAGKFILEK